MTLDRRSVAHHAAHSQMRDARALGQPRNPFARRMMAERLAESCGWWNVEHMRRTLRAIPRKPRLCVTS